MVVFGTSIVAARIAHDSSQIKAFWEVKLGGNVRRDWPNRRKLRLLGWKTAAICECETESPEFEKMLVNRAKRLIPAHI